MPPSGRCLAASAALMGEKAAPLPAALATAGWPLASEPSGLGERMLPAPVCVCGGRVGSGCEGWVAVCWRRVHTPSSPAPTWRGGGRRGGSVVRQGAVGSARRRASLTTADSIHSRLLLLRLLLLLHHHCGRGQGAAAAAVVVAGMQLERWCSGGWPHSRHKRRLLGWQPPLALWPLCDHAACCCCCVLCAFALEHACSQDRPPPHTHTPGMPASVACSAL
jgi:hypothetical protein